MKRLSSIFQGQKSLKNIISDAEVLQKIQANWPEIMGKLATDLKASYVKDWVLFIDSKNPLWVSEIEFFKPEILKKIEGVLGSKKIKNLKTKFNADAFIESPVETIHELSQSKNLEIMIFENNQQKIRAGLVLCDKCAKVYVKKETCIFCKGFKEETLF